MSSKCKKPIKQHAGSKQKETSFDRVFRQTDALMDDLTTIADQLNALFPQFKRLSLRNRKIIYAHINANVYFLEDAVDEYKDALPESESDEPASDLTMFGTAIGLMMFFELFRDMRSGNAPDGFKGSDVIDIERSAIKHKPKLLKPAKNRQAP